MKNGIVTVLLLSISLFAVSSTAQDKDSVGSHSAQVPEEGEGHTKRAIEHKLAGLQPGRDTMDKAYHRFRKDLISEAVSSSSSAVWVEPCNGQMLTVGFAATGIIREVRTERVATVGDCTPGSYSRSARAWFGGTGRGLVLGDSCNRIQLIYGEPQNQSRSIHGDKEFAYRFDVAVKRSPLAFEVSCDSVRDEVESIRLTVSGHAQP